MQSAKPSIRGRHRFAVRRAAGVLALMLFARQTTAPLWVACHEAGSGSASVAMPGMGHDDTASPGKAPANAPANAPAPSRDKSCDDSMAGTACCVASTCVVALAAPPVVNVSVARTNLELAPVPAASLLSLDIAPAVPPPRT